MKDLRGCEVRATGRDGLSAETVLRRALLDLLAAQLLDDEERCTIDWRLEATPAA